MLQLSRALVRSGRGSVLVSADEEVQGYAFEHQLRAAQGRAPFQMFQGSVGGVRVCEALGLRACFAWGARLCRLM